MKVLKPITAFCCHNALYRGLKEENVQKAYVEGVHIVETPCSGKVDPVYILKAFEKGADCVVILSCEPGLCTTVEGSTRCGKRVARTKELLREAGLEPDRLVRFVVKRPALDDLENLMEKARKIAARFGPSPVR